MTMRRADQRAVQRPHARLVMPIRGRLEFLHRRADFKRGGRRGHRFSETYGDRIGDCARKFPQEFPALETENAAPQAVEIYGHDRRVNAFYDALHAAPEGKQLADTRDLALGKNAHDLAALDRV